MSHADRNKYMIDARNQWASTKDGQITLKTNDVNHAFSAGFDVGRKLNPVPTDNICITQFLQSQIDKMAGKSGIELFLHVHTDDTDTLPDRKDDLLADINSELGTNYQRKHIDNWIAGRVDTPKRAMQMARMAVLRAMIGDGNADKLRGLV